MLSRHSQSTGRRSPLRRTRLCSPRKGFWPFWFPSTSDKKGWGIIIYHGFILFILQLVSIGCTVILMRSITSSMKLNTIYHRHAYFAPNASIILNNSSLDLILRCTFDTPCTGTVMMPEYQGIYTIPPQRLRGGEDHPILCPELQRTDGHIINTYSVHTTYYILERACCITFIRGWFFLLLTWTLYPVSVSP